MRFTSADGFTLIELLVVMSLILILGTLALPQYKHSVLYTREAVLREDLFRLRDAIDQYYADKGRYPETLDTLVADGYIRKVPVDPITQSEYTWQTSPAEPDGSDPTARGTYDVRSGSDRTALDGTKYSDWR